MKLISHRSHDTFGFSLGYQSSHHTWEKPSRFLHPRLGHWLFNLTLPNW